MKLQSMDSSSPEELSLAVKSIGLKAVRYCFGDIIFATNSVEV